MIEAEVVVPAAAHPQSAVQVPYFDLEGTVPEWALAFRFDIVLRGRNQTPTGQ